MTMAPMSVSGFCKLFCCPPFPSRIAAKLAFMPPKQSYNIIPDDSGLSNYSFEPHESADWQFGPQELELLKPCFARTRRGNRIACLHVRCPEPNASPYTILFSHGNAVDLGQMSSFLLSLARWLRCNIFCYDYSGYGCSSGKPSEKNLYADIDAAFKMLQSRYELKSDRIIVYGQSIGTVPTIDIASRQRVAAAILHSPLTSGLRVAFPATKRSYCFDAFPNIDKVSKIKSPVLVIHGTEDEVIDFTHGLAIYEKCPVTVDPLWVEGAGHNDVEIYSQYVERLHKFVHEELPNRHANGDSSEMGSRSVLNLSSGRENRAGPSSHGIVSESQVVLETTRSPPHGLKQGKAPPVGASRIRRASSGGDSLGGDSGSEVALDLNH